MAFLCSTTQLSQSSLSVNNGKKLKLRLVRRKALQDAAGGASSTASIKSSQALLSRQDLVCKDGSQVNDAAELQESAAPTDVSCVSVSAHTDVPD